MTCVVLLREVSDEIRIVFFVQIHRNKGSKRLVVVGNKLTNNFANPVNMWSLTLDVSVSRQLDLLPLSDSSILQCA